MSNQIPGFVKISRWKAEELDGKSVSWHVIHKGSHGAAPDGFLDGTISAVAYEDGMIVKLLLQGSRPDFIGAAEHFLSQAQYEELQFRDGKFLLL